MSAPLLRKLLTDRARHASPFLVLGDPTPEISVELGAGAVARGATMLELGIAYDDPCADGPAIQAASTRARRAGMDTARAFELIAELRRRCPDTALNLLVYGNLVHARGYATFCREAVRAGASSLLVPDIPLAEFGPLGRACREAGLGIVQLVAPLTSPERLEQLSAEADTFLYLAAHQGVTGKRARGAEAREAMVRRIANATERPLCLGFGLSQPDELRSAFDAGARICVIGSHLARAIERACSPSAADSAAVQRAFFDAWQPLADAAREPETQET